MNEQFQEVDKQISEIVELLRPEGRYHILYGAHTVIQNPETVPAGLNGVFLETGRNDYVSDPIGTLKKFKEGTLISPYSLRPLNQYQAIFESLETNKTPIYLADLYFAELNAWDAATLGITLTLLGEGAIGTLAGVSLYKSPTLSRRSFLKGAVGVWGIAPFASLSRNSALNQTSDFIHPEVKALKQFEQDQFDFLVNTLREVSIAHKLGYLMRLLGNNPQLGVFIGRNHMNTPQRPALEWQIERPEQDRIAYLSSVKDNISWSIKPESFYQIVECRFNGDNWNVTEVIEVPELKRLIT